MTGSKTHDIDAVRLRIKIPIHFRGIIPHPGYGFPLKYICESRKNNTGYDQKAYASQNLFAFVHKFLHFPLQNIMHVIDIILALFLW